MRSNSLKGNLLCLYLALSLEKKDTLRVPWDYWNGGLICDGREFGPFDTKAADQNPYALAAIMPIVSKWGLSSRPIGNATWLVETPDGRSYMAPHLIHAYALAIFGCVLGEDLPEWFEDTHLSKKVFLPPYNVEHGCTGPSEAVPNLHTFQAPAAGTISYSEALGKAKTMVAEEQAYNYSCDGHSWVQLQLMDGTVHTLYQGESTIGLPSMPYV